MTKFKWRSPYIRIFDTQVCKNSMKYELINDKIKLNEYSLRNKIVFIGF